MPKYVDGFVIPIAKKNVANYKKIASAASKIWIEHGALDYCECIGDEVLAIKGLRSFAELAGAQRGETVIFAWATFRSKKARDRANAKIMKDPRVAALMPAKPPFDCMRMAYGGFDVLVEK